MLYQLIVLFHVISIFGFLLAHGASVSITFLLKRERDIAKIRAMLDVSAASYPFLFGSLLAAFFLGLVAAFMVGEWWRSGWLWVSVVMCVIIVVLMATHGSGVFGELRRAVGLPYRFKGKPFPAEPAKGNEEIFAVQAKINPAFLLAIGYGGFAVIAWLMIAKPF